MQVCQALPYAQASTSFRSSAQHAAALRCCPSRVAPSRRQLTQRRVGALSDVVNNAVKEISQSVLLPHPGLLTGAALTTAVFTGGYKVLRKGLTPVGILHAWFLGTSIYSAFGVGGFSLVCLYFIWGTLVTKVKMEQKQKEGIAEARGGQRGPGSVWGSGFAGTACALAALMTGDYSFWQVGFVASFTSKLSDTVSSEIGKAYGKTTYLVTTFERVPRGTEGAVSAEGTGAGVLAAIVYAGLACVIGQVSVSGALTAAGAAVFANLLESYLGAVVQGRVEWLSNDLVNIIQISIAAAVAITLSHTLHLATPA